MYFQTENRAYLYIQLWLFIPLNLINHKIFSNLYRYNKKAKKG